MITLELPPDVEARLAAQARAHGLDLPTYAAQVLSKATAPVAPIHRQQQTPEEIRAWLDELAQFSDRIPAMPAETSGAR